MAAKVKQAKLPMRGYTLCDSDPRWPVLSRLRALGEHEEELLTRLEDDGFEEWEEAEQELLRVERETRAVLDAVAHQVKGWWL